MDKKIPQFIRNFSKESPEDRSYLAQNIRNERTAFFENKKNDEQFLESLNKEIEEIDNHITEKVSKVIELKKDLSNTPWYKFRRKEGIQGKIEDLEYGTLDENFNDGISLKKSIKEGKSEYKEKITQKLNQSYDLPDKLLKKIDNFYTDIKEEWKNEEFSAEDIQKYFSDEVLEKLSLEDYLLLWERFPNAAQTHVVRQGIRDHIGLNMGFAFHNIGQNKNFDNFKELLTDKHLKDTISLFFGNPITKESLKQFIEEDNHNFTDRNSRIKFLKDIVKGNNLARYLDKAAIHFGVNNVLDQYYGAESDNEVFVVFPSAYLASQHKFISSQMDFGNDNAENDRFIWSDNPNGIPINSGIICIPKNTMVDKKTGSKYLLDENKNPILKNEELQLAENTITSQEYWKNYFKENPESKPKRVFYYESKDATEALNNELGVGHNFESIIKHYKDGKFMKGESRFTESFDYKKAFSENTNYETEYYNKKKSDLEKAFKELNLDEND